jgi:hypothetical protein
VVQDNAFKLVHFSTGSAALARAIARLEKLDPGTIAQAIGQAAPNADRDTVVSIDGPAVDAIIRLLVTFGRREDVQMEEVEQAADPFPNASLASQSMIDAAREANKRQLDANLVLDSPVGPTRDKRLKAKKLVVVTEELLVQYQEVLMPAFKFMLCSKSQSFNQGMVKNKFATSLGASEQEDAAALCLK